MSYTRNLDDRNDRKFSFRESPSQQIEIEAYRNYSLITERKKLLGSN